MKKKFKRKTYKGMFRLIILGTIILIISLTFFLIVKFNRGINKTVEDLSEIEIKRLTYDLINDKITNNILNKDTLKDILLIYKNDKKEILYVDFDLDKAYKVLDKVTNVLSDTYKNIADSDISIAYLDKDLSHSFII